MGEDKDTVAAVVAARDWGAVTAWDTQTEAAWDADTIRDTDTVATTRAATDWGVDTKAARA